MLFQINKDIEISFDSSKEERIIQMRVPFITANVKVEEKETFVFPVQHGLKLDQQYFPIKIQSGVTKLIIKDIKITKPSPKFIPIYLKNIEIFNFKETPEFVFSNDLCILFFAAA